MTLDEYERIVQFLSPQTTEKEVKQYTRYFKSRLTGEAFYSLSVESHLCFVLAIMKVPKEEILNMTFEEGLTYIHLFGD